MYFWAFFHSPDWTGLIDFIPYAVIFRIAVSSQCTHSACGHSALNLNMRVNIWNESDVFIEECLIPGTGPCGCCHTLHPLSSHRLTGSRIRKLLCFHSLPGIFLYLDTLLILLPRLDIQFVHIARCDFLQWCVLVQSQGAFVQIVGFALLLQRVVEVNPRRVGLN